MNSQSFLPIIVHHNRILPTYPAQNQNPLFYPSKIRMYILVVVVSVVVELVVLDVVVTVVMVVVAK